MSKWPDWTPDEERRLLALRAEKGTTSKSIAARLGRSVRGDLLATAAIEGTLLALFGAVLIAIGFWVKARAEERFLLAELGADVYESYRRRVPMLMPFVPHR